MSPTSREALNLPSHAPPFTADRGSLDAPNPAKFFIFHTTPLTPSLLLELENTINSSSPSGLSACKLAPAPDFSSASSVRDVFDAFLALREEDQSVQPFYFVVADRADFGKEGVLGVCLDVGQEGEGDVGVARCNVEWAGEWGEQMLEGVVGFDEMKECEAAVWDGEVEGEDLRSEARHAQKAAREGWEVGNHMPRDRTVYGWYSLVEKAVPINSMLDPEWLDKTPEQCRFQMLGNWFSSADPWADICREHPRQAAFRPRVHRSIVLVAEKEDAGQEDGVAIVRLESNRAPVVLARVRAGAAIAEADSWVASQDD